MTDLEIIKQLCDVTVPYNEVCEIHANDLGEIQEAAERMAARIAELEKRPEVVRCGECEHALKARNNEKDRVFCELMEYNMAVGFYCADGVRKAKGEE